MSVKVAIMPYDNNTLGLIIKASWFVKINVLSKLKQWNRYLRLIANTELY